ncbi:hypothetical protein [Streptomyces sp. NPDC002467]|uniref:hypothetical protein n=1 Tax=Streptomyces sp. NPDC002467 TaxID=3364647 RepID=UPI0036A1C79F
MPRSQSTAAQRAREAQQQGGGKFTALLRQAAGGEPLSTFALRDLLAECSTSPLVVVDWDYHPDYDVRGPQMFDSELMGGPVPYGTVLALAGALSQSAMDAELLVESHSRLEGAVVRCEGRRFNLVLTQEMVYELCRTPRCHHHPVEEFDIPFCTAHLAERSTEELVRMARAWGYAQHETHSNDPGNATTGLEGTLLVRAAVARAAVSETLDVMVEACFQDPNLIDDVYWDADVAMAVRHGMDRERLRLEKEAKAEAARLRKAAGDSCTTCGRTLSRHWPGWNVPPQFCSTTCAPDTPPQPSEGNPWARSFR